MECYIIHCGRRAKYTYKIGEAEFVYCDKHTSIPKKIFDNAKRGFYKGYERNANLQNS